MSAPEPVTHPADPPTHVRTAADAERLWRRLMGPLGFGGHCTWIQVVEHDQPIREVIQVERCDGLPDPDPQPLARFLTHLTDGLRAPRLLFLRSRPGSGSPDDVDLAWAAVLYAASRAAGVPCEVVHLAHDRDVLPVPVDALLEPVLGA